MCLVVLHWLESSHFSRSTIGQNIFPSGALLALDALFFWHSHRSYVGFPLSAGCGSGVSGRGGTPGGSGAGAGGHKI